MWVVIFCWTPLQTPVSSLRNRMRLWSLLQSQPEPSSWFWPSWSSAVWSELASKLALLTFYLPTYPTPPPPWFYLGSQVSQVSGHGIDIWNILFTVAWFPSDLSIINLLVSNSEEDYSNISSIVALSRLAYLYNVSLVLGGKFFTNFIHSSIFSNPGF